MTNSADKKYTILAPAGSVEQLKAAVNNGCDAVYLGLDVFNARMKAPNFTAENVKEWIDYCHFFDVKVYVAVNTSIKNDEFDKAVNALLCAYDSNADGVIVTDLALMKLASALPKPFEIVASTQLNVHDRYGAEFVKQLGATTVVCARECSFEDIEDISQSGIKVESFIHGALCVCQSGQCLFSSMVGGNSGNRGLCAQPCRKKYTANNGASGYLLSASDILGLDVAKRLFDAGVSVFKIEGRNRRAEYAGAASSVYGALFENNFAQNGSERGILCEMYNRHSVAPSYLSKNNDGVIYSECQNHSGVYVGKVSNGGSGFLAAESICKGDGLKVFSCGEEVGGGVATSSGVGYVSAKFDYGVKDGMEVHRTTSVELCKKILSAVKTKAVSLYFSGTAGKKALITAACGKCVASVESDFVLEKAVTSPVSKDDLVKQLRKNSNPLYTITDIEVKIDDIFMAKSQINGLRRAVLDSLTEEIESRLHNSFAYRKRRIKPAVREDSAPVYSGDSLSVICKTEEEVFDCLKQRGIDRIIYKPEFIEERKLQFLRNYDRVYLDIPSFADLRYVEKIAGDLKVNIVCHNVGHIELARKFGLRFIVGSGMNIFNDNSVALFCDADAFVYSEELSLQEIARFKNRNGITFIDGEIVLMKFVHCPYKAVYGGTCAQCKADRKLTYTDELGNVFYLKRRKDSRCTFELLNGKKLSAVGKLKESGRYLVDYDRSVIEHYGKLNSKIQDGYEEKSPFTRGRLYSKIN